jgi:hypothetical protein
MTPEKDGCVKPVRGPIVPQTTSSQTGSAPAGQGRQPAMLARVGGEAIDFEATAYIEGQGFQPVRLSDYRGKWIVLCFYPGGFTFV